MTEPSFYWHDYETFGRHPRRDRPAQFAGVRTDLALREIEPPSMWHCKPAPDFLPDPESCLLTGILPQECLARGLDEHAFADAIEAQLARPGTIGVGYNSIRFDDEVTRHLFWRNLLDPYAREWQNGCGRWDLLDVVRCARALRPDGIVWPQHADGRASFKLGDLTAANGIAHVGAHDALADVRATLALARLVRTHNPKLFDFCLSLHRKEAVRQQFDTARANGAPLLHVSGMYPAERGCLALIWPLAPHPTKKNEVIVWDLAVDPSILRGLDVATIRERLYSRADALPEGIARLPIKTIHLNRSPVVIANLRTLGAERAAQWGLDVDQALRHAETATAVGADTAGLWPEVYARPDSFGAVDVDEDLYGGFVGTEDRRLLQRLRALPPAKLAERHAAFADPRLAELVFRYRARNFPETLDAAEAARWEAHRRVCLHDGIDPDDAERYTLARYFDRIDELGDAADERGQALLGALYDYAEQIAPALD